MLEQIINGNFTNNFHPAGDYITIFIATILMLMIIPYSSVANKYRMMLIVSIVSTDIGACLNLFCYNDTTVASLPEWAIYALHWGYVTCFALSALMLCAFFWYSIRCNEQLKKTAQHAISILFISLVILEPLTYITGGFTIGINNNLSGNMWLNLGLIYHVTIFLFNMLAFTVDKSNNITRKTIRNTSLISYAILFATLALGGTTSYMGACFIVPQIIIMYYYHSYAFDIETGALDFHGLIHYLQRCEDSVCKKQQVMVCLKVYTTGDPETYIQEVNSRMKSVKFKVFRYSKTKYVYVVQESDSHLFPGILMHPTIHTIAVSFPVNNSVDKISIVLKSVFDNMRYTNRSTYSVLTERIQNKYEKAGWIKSQLMDIAKQNDLNDPRILVYCQPIINVQTRTFDTAESLMRLQLPSQTQPNVYEMVYPDEFIPIAEENNLIHALTLIILNKVCEFVQENNDAYHIKRMSVNLSALDLISNDDVDSVINIIESHKLNKSQIAIEITESANIDYVALMRSLRKLRDHDILIYLDDFGTGYSNLTKVFNLPFDIVKFDKSLLDGEEATPIVHDIIPTIRNMGMSILHEGIETDEMEELCEKLGFDYLQGYKYSKPIPVNDLTVFLEKK